MNPQETKNVPKRNFQREMDKLLENMKNSGQVKKLFLHCCCAPCSSYVLEYLSNYFQITAFFYNPNIDTDEEYSYRQRELIRFIKEKTFENSVEIVSGDYRPEKFEDIAKGYEDCKEGGARCMRCFDLRLRETAKLAKEYNADFFATTLTVSPLKNAQAINAIGEKIGKEFEIEYLPSDFKKKNGYKRTIELSREFDLYRQNFCGCSYSKKQSEKND